MGMFDYVKVNPIQNCFKCGSVLTRWQSKDRACIMDEVPFWTCSKFYTSCDACGTWHEYNLKNRERPLSDYDLKVEMIITDKIGDSDE